MKKLQILWNFIEINLYGNFTLIRGILMKGSDIFENLFVLELANNHWGSIERGKKIIREFAKVVKENKVKASIKLQFRDVDNFIHKKFKDEGSGQELTNLKKRTRYIQKTSKTKLTYDEFKELIEYIKKHDCIPMATPFDEKSVDFCVELDLPIIKIASSDINDWVLLNKIASTKKPVIISTGGANDKQIDDVVSFFVNRNIPLAINHCVSKYPSEDDELELNQIDYLKQKYPKLVVGLSTHEYHDWHSSMLISYAKGARTWERHIDIPYPKGHEQKEVSNYCSLPHQIDEWFKAYKKSVIMCGTSSNVRRVIDEKESIYLESLYRGLYLKRDMKSGEVVEIKDLYGAIPYQKEIGHISSRDFIEKDSVLICDMKKDEPLLKNNIK
jgi:sialic acid synthase SpsE